MSLNFIKDKTRTIHFIGIGGISMSGLAMILLNFGYKVSGSDMKSSPITDKLVVAGSKLYIGHKAENVANAGLVVYTAAISKDNPEFLEAQRLNIPMMSRAEFLGLVMKDHKYNVAISGTHGKTSTTSMLSLIALNAKVDPTILVGGELDAIGGNYRVGKGEYFIAEACEYKASFLKFFPYIGVILNIDADHLDFYKDIQDIENTFDKFAKLIPKDGYLIGCAEDKRVLEVISKANCNSLTYGFEKGDVRATDISFDDQGCGSFTASKEGKALFSISLSVPGKHNILNALASICTSIVLDLPEDAVISGLKDYSGAHKRFEKKGFKNGVTVIDDYAHHPTEIKATLNTALKLPHKKIYCVFQPHTYSRTLSLFDDFTNCFNDADVLILADIYAAREKDTHVVSSDMLGDSIRSTGKECINLHSFQAICDYLKNNLQEGDLLLTVGAGDIVKVGEMYLA